MLPSMLSQQLMVRVRVLDGADGQRAARIKGQKPDRREDVEYPPKPATVWLKRSGNAGPHSEQEANRKAVAPVKQLRGLLVPGTASGNIRVRMQG